MSSMADQMAARMGIESPAGDPAPGNGTEPNVTPPPPAAEPSTTDTGGSNVPETIPYARFKEVNDRLSSYRDLEQFGYDADSLRRLASFEQQYLTDPVGTWASLADNLDLPQELKDALAQHLAGDATPEPGPAGGNGSEEKPTLELPPEVQKRLDYVDRLQAEREESDRMAQLDRVVEAWDNLDRQDQFAVGDEHRDDYERMKLMAISATAGSGVTYNSVDELAAAARQAVMGFRSSVLGEAVQRTVRGGSPAPLPGGGSAPAPPVRFGSLKDANRAIAAAIERGELPGTQRG